MRKLPRNIPQDVWKPTPLPYGWVWKKCRPSLAHLCHQHEMGSEKLLHEYMSQECTLMLCMQYGVRINHTQYLICKYGRHIYCSISLGEATGNAKQSDTRGREPLEHV